MNHTTEVATVNTNISRQRRDRWTPWPEWHKTQSSMGPMLVAVGHEFQPLAGFGRIHTRRFGTELSNSGMSGVAVRLLEQQTRCDSISRTT